MYGCARAVSTLYQKQWYGWPIVLVQWHAQWWEKQKQWAFLYQGTVGGVWSEFAGAAHDLFFKLSSDSMEKYCLCSFNFSKFNDTLPNDWYKIKAIPTFGVPCSPGFMSSVLLRYTMLEYKEGHHLFTTVSLFGIEMMGKCLR